LDYAAACGASHVTTLPGVYFDNETVLDQWKRCCEELAWRVEQARRMNITFSVEAHLGSIVPHPSKVSKLLSCVPGLSLTLDYTHFVRRGLADGAVEPLIRHATHFHARGARRGRLQASFKQNTIDYLRILRSMRKVGYAGYIGVEYVWDDWEHCNEVDNLSETIQMRDFLRSSGAR
jgi:sugar phosphate isomerase/epimerase